MKFPVRKVISCGVVKWKGSGTKFKKAERVCSCDLWNDVPDRCLGFALPQLGQCMLLLILQQDTLVCLMLLSSRISPSSPQAQQVLQRTCDLLLVYASTTAQTSCRFEQFIGRIQEKISHEVPSIFALTLPISHGGG